MGTNTGHIMTLANSIIGVSVLAMPFCYKQCGIVLASLMLIISSVMTRLSCYYLIKSAVLARRRNFEFLAFHAFGPMGKLTVELCTIGFLLGTCIAFFVVMGDLGPAILGPVFGVQDPTSIRATVLIAIAIFVVLPLGLLRNVDSLAAISAATIAFYICLVVKVMGEATTNLVTSDWMDKVVMWRPAGLLQCIPIFSMALSCQTQLFEIFDSIPNATLEKMNIIVRSAVNMCTLMYMAMGFFGYVAFCSQSFSGNLMLSFSPTATSEVIKMGFVLSVAVSFPLVIFPCRASLHSLLYRKGIPPHHELLSANERMPEARFKGLTAAIVAVSLAVGALIPNIELVLGLVGSTIGVVICVIMPATLFLAVASAKRNNDRLLAQVLFFMGLTIMVLGTYANLFATEEVMSEIPADISSNHLENAIKEAKDSQFKDKTLEDIINLSKLEPELPKAVLEKADEEIVNENKDTRKEPPIPVAPEENVVNENLPLETKLDSKQIIPKDKETPILESNALIDKEDEKNSVIKTENEDINAVKQQEILKIKPLQHKEVKAQNENQLLKEVKIEPKDLTKEIVENDSQNNKDKKELNDKMISIKHQDVAKPNENNNLIKSDMIIKTQKKLTMSDPDAKIKEKAIPEKKNDVNLDSPPDVVEKIAPQVNSVETVNMVRKVLNPVVLKLNPKVMNRDILEESKEKQQREKRDLEELAVDINSDKTRPTVDKEKVESHNVIMNKNEHHNNTSFTANNTKSKLHQGNVTDSSTKENIDIPKEREIVQSEKEIDGNHQCSKDNKPKSPLLIVPTVISEISMKGVETKTELQNMPKSPQKDKSEMTESIIKSPAYLSNPTLVLTNAKVESLMDNNNINVNSVPKPMKRDLKSLDIKRERKKEADP